MLLEQHLERQLAAHVRISAPGRSPPCRPGDLAEKLIPARSTGRIRQKCRGQRETGKALPSSVSRRDTWGMVGVTHEAVRALLEETTDGA